MTHLQNQDRFIQLRAKYGVFTYQKYRIIKNQEGIQLIFHFDLAGQYHFQPEIFIPARPFLMFDLNEDLLHQLAFHIGMVELISYWKLSCCPVVEILPHALHEDQIRWWKKLYYHGLGEFFYINGIETNMHDFMDLRSAGMTALPAVSYTGNGEVIVPVGGGKDSVVSLELLGQAGRKIRPMIVNPRNASSSCVQMAGFDTESTIIIQRSLDPLMLQMNEQGFLNGHTPFSALLAFTSALVAVAGNFTYIALSNESSASEATVPDTEINHQYSKSIEFERDFRNYLQQYIAPGLEYFSFLRPLNELQIASLFSRMTNYHPVFKSCNVGSKTDRWCCECPKCLFTWVMLSPFLDKDALQSIFGENLADKTSLRPLLASLKGETAAKPFECVGTTEEVNAAVELQAHANEPGKLFQLWRKPDIQPVLQQRLHALLSQFDNDHFLPEAFEGIVRRALQ